KQNSRLAEDAILLRVASNYLAVVNAGRRIDIEKRNVELAQKRLDQANAFYSAGEVTKVDVFRAETAMKAAQRLMQVAEQAREHVHTAIADLHAAQTSLQLAQEQLSAAQAEYDQAFELYRAQEATSLDVATSEASLAEARRAVAEEPLNRDLAELRVWFAAGNMKG